MTNTRSSPYDQEYQLEVITAADIVVRAPRKHAGGKYDDAEFFEDVKNVLIEGRMGKIGSAWWRTFKKNKGRKGRVQ